MLTTLSGGGGRMMSARWFAASISIRKPSGLAGRAGPGRAGDVTICLLLGLAGVFAGDELAAQDLADRRFRDFGHEHVIARALEIGEARGPAMRIERRRIDRLLALDEGDDLLAPAFIGQAGDRDLADGRMQ